MAQTIRLNKRDNTIRVIGGKKQTIKVVNRREELKLQHTGKTGPDGASVVSITKTGSTGLIDTYTIAYSNNTTTTFEVTNGATPYIQDNYWYIDGVDTGVKATGIDGYTPIKGIDYFDGEDGTNDANFIKNFTTLSVVDVNHNLNKLVAVSVIDSANSEVIGDISYIDLNNIRVSFASAFSGTIMCN